MRAVPDASPGRPTSCARPAGAARAAPGAQRPRDDRTDPPRVRRDVRGAGRRSSRTSARRHDRRARPDRPRGTSVAAATRARSATRAPAVDLHVGQRGRSATASPRPHALADGDIVNIDVTALHRRRPRRHVGDVPVGAIDRRSPACSTPTRAGARGRHRGGRAGPAGERASGGRSRRSCAAGTASSASSSGTRSAATSTAPLVIPHGFEASARTVLEEGMVFTIEPMVALGSGRARIRSDGWTAVTARRQPVGPVRAHRARTADGCEALTRW